MTRNPAQEKLRDLLDTLHHLESQPIPRDAQVASQSANQYLSELVGELDLSQEQSRWLRGKPLGGILVERGDLFMEMDVQFLDHLVSRAAVAIANAQLYQDVQRANRAKSDFVSIVARSQENSVCIEIVDNGIGIRPEDQEKMFSQFFRSEDPLVRDEQGWGLGLNVAKRLVELMRGTIGFTSQVSNGSTFWFTLPTSELRINS